MKFVTFVENRYQECNLQMQKQKEYLLTPDAEIKALTQLLNGYRILTKYFLMPKIMWNFFQVNMGWKSEPEPVLLNKAKADLEAKKVAEKMAQEQESSNKEKVSPLFGPQKDPHLVS